MKNEPIYNLLNSINSPDDLRRLEVDQLPEVCDELRQDIIKELSCNPGHFAASLGTVELTVALHYVYNTPYDRIVWDVGHQAYGHKILTGRREAFSTNRKLGGIRPFPSPEESEYDTFTCGHASNSISAALGMAVAAAKKGAQVLMFGVGPQEAHFEMNTYDIYKKQLTIQGSFINPLTFRDAISLVSSGKMNIGGLISHELELEQVQDFLDGKVTGVSKAVVKVGK